MGVAKSTTAEQLRTRGTKPTVAGIGMVAFVPILLHRKCRDRKGRGDHAQLAAAPERLPATARQRRQKIGNAQYAGEAKEAWKLQRDLALDLGRRQGLTQELEALAPLVVQLRNLDEAIARLERAIAKLAQKDETARRLMGIPGFGPITASAMAATIQDTSSFAGPREFAAFLDRGLVRCGSAGSGLSERRPRARSNLGAKADVLSEGLTPAWPPFPRRQAVPIASRRNWKVTFHRRRLFGKVAG